MASRENSLFDKNRDAGESLNMSEKELRRSSVAWMTNMYWEDNENNIDNIKAKI